MDYFKLKKRNTNIRTEIAAGITTFMTMAYIIFVNPAILSQGGATGIPFEAAVIATCLGAGIMSIVMGVVANVPFALASGVGINTIVVFSIIYGLGLSWQQAMGIIILEGIIVAILVLTRLRRIVIDAIPIDLKYAMGAGIGLFISFIGVTEAGFADIDFPTSLRFGDFSSPYTLCALFGLVVTIILVVFRVRGAILVGIILTAILGIIVKIIPLPVTFFSIPTREAFYTFFRADIAGAIWSRGMLNIGALFMVLLLIMSDFFDTLGIVFGVGNRAGLFLNKEKISFRRILVIDSVSSIIGGLFGAGAVSTSAESATGVAEGGRTGIVPITGGVMFLLSIFFAPLIAVVGGGVEVGEGIYRFPVTAPALIVAGFFMMRMVGNINFKDIEIAIPAFLTIIIMPFTYGIFYGIGFGFISYTLIKLIRKKAKELHPVMIVISILFIAAFAAEAIVKRV